MEAQAIIVKFVCHSSQVSTVHIQSFSISILHVAHIRTGSKAKICRIYPKLSDNLIKTVKYDCQNTPNWLLRCWWGCRHCIVWVSFEQVAHSSKFFNIDKTEFWQFFLIDLSIVCSDLTVDYQEFYADVCDRVKICSENQLKSHLLYWL